MIVVVYQKFLDDITSLWVLWNQFLKSRSFLLWKVEFHVACNFLELVEELFIWSSDNVMNFVYLVKLISSWEKRSQRQYFKEYTSNSPVVHLVIIVAICQQAFRWSIPPC